MTPVRRVLAPNPGPTTLEGTNTWLLLPPGSRGAVLVDPGPDHAGHLAAVLAAVHGEGRVPELAVATHRHLDHVGALPGLARLAPVPVLAGDPAALPPGSGTASVPPARLDLPGLEVEVVPAPGHTADSLCLWLPGEDLLLTGDTVLGRGSTVVAAPDGRLGEFLATLRRLLELVAGRPARVLPGHGPVPAVPAEQVVAALLEHRERRLDEVRAAVDAGDRTPEQVVARVYPDLDPGLLTMARWSALAQLEYLGVAGEG